MASPKLPDRGESKRTKPRQNGRPNHDKKSIVLDQSSSFNVSEKTTMPGKGPLTNSEQLNYIVTWFSEYSEMQKDDFLKNLIAKYALPTDSTLSDSFNELSVANRPPSIFQCRMKLFNEWFVNWSDEEKAELLTRLHGMDKEFMTRLQEALADEVSNSEEINGASEDDEQ